MKGLLIAAATAALVVAGVYALNANDEQRGVAPVESSGQEPASPDAGNLRDELLHSTAQQVGVTPVRGVWGVLMERGYAKGTATIIALADGTASMYLSTGGSVVGGKAYPPAHAAALKLCEQAAEFSKETVSAQDFPLPAKGRVRFYVLTTDGVRVAEGDILPHATDGGHEPLAPLLAAGDAVLEGLKDATKRGLIR